MVDVTKLTFGCCVGTEETSVRLCLKYGESGFIDCTFPWETEGNDLRCRLVRKEISGGNLLPTLIMGGIARKRRDAFYVLSGNKQ
jgi:hypothetical protein